MTQQQAVLNYIKDFGSITSWQAFSDLGVTRLSAYIYNLKGLGYRFKISDIKKKNRYNKTVTFNKYELED